LLQTHAQEPGKVPTIGFSLQGESVLVGHNLRGRNDKLYRRLLGPTLREMVPPIGDDIEFDPPRMGDNIVRPVDFS
jgi:hypothetical protein